MLVSPLLLELRICLANLQKVFLNIVLDDAVEEKDGGEKVRLGMVVSILITLRRLGYQKITSEQVIRGNSVVMLEALERIGGGREDRG